MRILVTGGAGYIGATAVDVLISEGFHVSILDDLSTGHRTAVHPTATFIEGSLLDPASLSQALNDCEAVMHFAGKSLVGESVEKPDLYWNINVNGTRALLDEMHKQEISQLVFSSSAATYGAPEEMPISELAQASPTNPYGVTKLAIDEMISQQTQDFGLSAISLRYFNVAGALKGSRGWLPEKHNPETHLIPNLLKSTELKPIHMYGTDWPTPDGTAIRDYVHVTDLVQAHIQALRSLEIGKHRIINLGSGRGYSVREVLTATASFLGRSVPHIESPRRSGDPMTLIADISQAKEVLAWVPTRDISSMVADTAHSLEIV